MRGQWIRQGNRFDLLVCASGRVRAQDPIDLDYLGNILELCFAFAFACPAVGLATLERFRLSFCWQNCNVLNIKQLPTVYIKHTKFKLL